MDKHYRDLLIRALKGTLDTASRREFDLWVADADNRRIYENALRIWDDVQRRTSAYNPDRDRLWEQLQSRIEVCGTPQRAERPAPKRRWMPILRTAAAVAAGVVVTLFAVRPDLSRTPVPARQEFCAFGGKSLAPGICGRGKVVIAAQALCEGELRVMVGVRELEGLEMELQASERILRGLREQVTHWELGQLRVRERKESPLLSPEIGRAHV